MIEGENLRALSDLSELLAGSVDLIYLDPPYNTGDADRSYLDSFGSTVEWKGFLAPRLRAALPLLTRTGVVVISVGDAGLAPLRGLADEIFGARNYLTTLIQQGGVRNSARFTGAGVDYMLVYGRDRLAMRRADVRWWNRNPGWRRSFVPVPPRGAGPDIGLMSQRPIFVRGGDPGSTPSPADCMSTAGWTLLAGCSASATSVPRTAPAVVDTTSSTRSEGGWSPPRRRTGSSRDLE